MVKFRLVVVPGWETEQFWQILRRSCLKTDRLYRVPIDERCSL